MNRSKALLAASCAAVAAAAMAQQTPPEPPPGSVDRTGRVAQARVLSDTSAFVTDYPLGANDVIEISVFELPELDQKRRVTEDGAITLPLLGQVYVGGLNEHEAEQAIAGLLRERNLVRNPQVTVFVVEYVSRRVNVTGAVGKPGLYPLLGPRTLLDMIGEAGGLDQRAGKRIIVMRAPHPGAEDERIEIDAERLLYEGDPLLNIELQPGDIVLVPHEQMVRVYVTGAVRTPGAHEFARDERITVLQAITKAGGTTDRANKSKVKVLRRLPDGSERQFKVNLKRIIKGRATDMELQRNDIVVVEESFF
ncbi:MAG: SLBB domain-containing protein [Acidobacteriota bacterium]|nr:MAG: SLBB domain-containing protein [Acidobacteriota bacterium]